MSPAPIAYGNHTLQVIGAEEERAGLQDYEYILFIWQTWTSQNETKGEGRYGGPEVESVVFVARFTSSIRSLIR